MAKLVSTLFFGVAMEFSILFGSALKSRVEIFDLPEKIPLYSVEDVNFWDDCLSYENDYEEVV